MFLFERTAVESTALRQIKHNVAGIALFVIAGALAAAGCSGSEEGSRYLLRVGDQTVTVADFNTAVEAAGEEVFPGEKEIEQAALNDLRMRVLNQMSEELMISAFAAKKGIKVSREELAEAVSAIKADYPDNTFEETLIENAVSYEFWEKKLATRLLVKKVIDTELVSHVTISSDDVLAYYQKNYPDGTPEDMDADTLNQKVVTHLRQLKAEEAYKKWIEQLHIDYPVEVDGKVWNRLVNN